MMKKKVKKLDVKAAERKRVAVLLSELEQAAAQVLAQEFAMLGEQVAETMEQIRLAFQALKPAQMPPLQKQRLGVIAQTFGLAAAKTLVERQVITTQADGDRFLSKLVEAANNNRHKQPA